MLRSETLLRSNMKRTISQLLLALCIQDAVAQVSVDIERTDAHEVRATFLRESDSDLLGFAATLPDRAQQWKPSVATLVVDPDHVTSQVPFSRAEFFLSPDKDIVDRRWPLLLSITPTTSVLNLDYVRTAQSEGALTYSIANAYDPMNRRCKKQITLRDSQESKSGRFVLLSTGLRDCAELESNVKRGVIAAPDAPTSLLEVVGSTLNPAYLHLTQSFRRRPAKHPIVFLSYDRFTSHNDYRASAGWMSSILLQFRGPAWSGDIRGNEKAIRLLVAHEIVHLWIGDILRPVAPEGLNADWLAEGAAEYIAATALAQLASISKQEYLDTIGSHVEACLRGLGNRSLLTSRVIETGPLVYSCGVLVQFAYDLQARSDSHGRSDIFDVWQRLLPSTTRKARQIEATTFLRLLPAAERMLQSVLSGPKVEQDAIVDGLKKLGANISEEPVTDRNTVILAALQPLFRAHCVSGPYGFMAYPTHIELDVNDSCTSIPDKLHVRYLQGVDLLLQPEDALSAATHACTELGSMSLSGSADGSEQTFSCKDAAVRPSRLRLHSLPFLNE